MTIDVNLLAEAITKKTRAIIPVHLYGHPANMASIMALAKVHELKVVEDCAEALGSRYEDTHVGNFGDAAIFSFFGNKTITTGEGGMVIFRDEEVAERARVLRDHGMDPSRRYWHNEIGFNYRLTNIQAAIGVAQLERIEYFVGKKRSLAYSYGERLGGIASLILPKQHENVLNSYWLYTVYLDSKCHIDRNQLLLELEKNGIEARPIFFPIHQMPPYIRYAGNKKFPVSDYLSLRGLSLPSSVEMTVEDIDKVCSALKVIIC